uniref:Alpha-aminoacylpeptide hydrolase n=1 Tax=Manihot esculenta TaxID=3983 RepID=A0A2C9UXB4_MANES
MEQFTGQTRLPKFAVPKFAVPQRYNLHLKPDLTLCSFSGTIIINLSINEPTKFIVLMLWSSISMKSCSPTLTTNDTLLDCDDEIFVLVFPEILGVGEGVLQIKFSGMLNEHLRGFYKCTYMDGEEKKNMAVTQFEAVDARRCFPCWDEPALKLTALSSMPIIDEKHDGNVKTVYFEESPFMSTYLVAVVIGVKVRVYCPVGKSDKGKYALSIAIKALDLYTAYFSTPCPLPKLDMVAVPEFAGGAMENYGLIIYLVLRDDLQSTAARMQRLTIVLHEVAHQWFGNMVTMEWWTHLWLNEGFATWISYMATDRLFPEWKIWTQFLQATSSGLGMDALEGLHPIEVEIQHARSMDEIFDAISYMKGSAIIRMLQGYLGDDMIQKSLSSYMKKYGWGKARTEDLWSLISEESGVQSQFLTSGLHGCSNASSTNKSGFEYLLKIYQKLIQCCIASCPDPEIVLEALNFMVSDEASNLPDQSLVLDQDIIYGLPGISLEGHETAWRWLKENWDKILRKYGAALLITHFIRDIISPFCSNEKADEVEQFFVSRANPSIATNLKQSIEKLRMKARWISSTKQEDSLQELVK